MVGTGRGAVGGQVVDVRPAGLTQTGERIWRGSNFLRILRRARQERPGEAID